MSAPRPTTTENHVKNLVRRKNKMNKHTLQTVARSHDVNR